MKYAVLGVFLLTVGLGAQLKEFDFYPEFRTWFGTLPPTERQPLDAMLERYRQRLSAAGVPDPEVARRTTLIRTRRPELEADFWNRFFTVDAPAFNTAPNEFLVATVQDRKPGRALDVGMGEGRNALYLAKLGWQVTGFDPADKAVALAQERAKAMGLSIRTEVALDRNFDFGRARWDLILLSWMPANEPARLIEALAPGGIVVVEGPLEWAGPNGLLKAFAGLRILHYEEVMSRSDYFYYLEKKEIQVVRLVAQRLEPPAAQQVSAPATAAIGKTLEEIGVTLQTSGRIQAQAVAGTLKELGARQLSADDHSTWIRLARTAALRTGDLEWLRELSKVEDAYSLDLIYTVLLAHGKLLQSDLAGAAGMLDRAERFAPINIRELRRVWALRARIAQLTGDVTRERALIDKMVDHLAAWKSPSCQGCHGPVKEPKTLASLPINRLWYGERYVELLKMQGDAGAVRKAAEDKLAVNPRDEDARIHLAFALRAQGSIEESEREFKKLTWADYPDRPLVKPRMMTSFP